ncbi:glycoside hydrolase family 19 protein [Nocardia pseudobrasiliensis]|uniref:Putative chitinase n=1 Tax=Nocardia pseudobrasiliensis TaxID=45979 RepID=A0A370I0Y1_9NOCA|nr:glycoside hydrolase family 19 protein [Nocardia pseudobrasiliensis]RDI64389.1 putative chitinase [Nocardia pseudobrasiliensis]
MTPPRSILANWRAASAAESLRAEFDRHIQEVEALSARVLDECRRLDGDGWQGAAYDAVLAHVETSHNHSRLLCARAEKLRDTGVRALSDLHHTGLALLDYVADAEAAGCVVADDWTVTADPQSLAAEWNEVITEAVAAVARADESGHRAIRAALGEMVHPAAFLTLPALPVEGEGAFVAVTAEQLLAVMPELPVDRAREYLPALNAAMREGEIVTPLRQAAFLAQIAHESGELRYFEELGDEEYFRQYDPDGANPGAGNTEPGDGPRYHGRGPLQLTGRANYRAAGAALGLDLEGSPELAAGPEVGFRIAQWYWTIRDINTLADAGDFVGVTRAVNGGEHGLAARETYYRRALAVLA